MAVVKIIIFSCLVLFSWTSFAVSGQVLSHSEYSQSESKIRPFENKDHVRRKREGSDTFTINVFVLVDYPLYEIFHSKNKDDNEAAVELKIKTYVTNILMGVAKSLFKTDKVVESYLEISFSGLHIIKEKRTRSIEDIAKKEVANLLKKHSFVLMFLGMDGIAPWGGFEAKGCGPSYGYVSDKLWYNTHWGATRAILTSFGIKLDGDKKKASACKKSERFMMGDAVDHKDPDTFLNQFTPSSCTSLQVRDFIAARSKQKCSYKPGRVLSSKLVAYVMFDDQCKSYYGSKSYLCSVSERKPDICLIMSCFNPTTRSCYLITPATGACCDVGKSCNGGVCAKAQSGFCTEAPPKDAPRISVNYQNFVDNNGKFTVPLGSRVRVSCKVTGGLPQVISTSMKCEGLLTFTKPTWTITIAYKALKNSASVRCVCAAVHKAGYSRTTSVTIDIEKPPTEPPKISVNNNSVDRNGKFTVGLGDNVNVSCEVTGGSPKVSKVSIKCTGFEPVLSEGSTSLKRYDALRNVGSVQCVCSAQHKTSRYDLKTSVTIDIAVVPPSTAPNMTLNGKYIGNNERFSFNSDELLAVACSIDGGYPYVSNTTFGCTGMSKTTMEGKSVNKTFVAKKDMEAVCVCSAEHETGSYNQTTTFFLVPNKKSAKKSAKVIVLSSVISVVGITVVFLVVAGVLYFHKQYTSKRVWKMQTNPNPNPPETTM